ncbi:hypothetical protein GCM10011504_48530 [Siccirubricoccus deserti]|uniref:DUF305 domain-containing protein n=1 Tax=Siccirubricoccus deserti TaxID=2013562 RepID=UPI001986BB86|nr:DUF305 domain-containing protein [Siccirubricoccus deserti]GGC64699.1 hypothetical protein GCM10011504_48530 [Siccirubricoccus deserti]
MPVNWRAAALLGLITSSYSTLVAQLLAARVGRDAVVDWMVVASIPAQDLALQAEPSWPVILGGILFHQSADFLWAVVFFGLLGRWTAGLRPWTILLVGIPWAVFTSAFEYFGVVPFWQPVFTLNQPYWVGLLVHLTSASLYPLFPWLRDWLAGRASPHRRFAAWWSGVTAAGVLGMAVLAFLGWHGREWPSHLGGALAYDQGWMRAMAAHHRQGVAVARVAEQAADDPHLRSLARLMIAGQAGDVMVLEQWWRGWFGTPVLPPPEEHMAMPGMLAPEQLAALDRSAGKPGFDALFVTLMTHHHQGAIAMADAALGRAGDPRLRLMAHAIRHAQRGEILLMQGIPRGFAVSGAAALALIAPAGRHPADGGPAVHR